MFSERSLKRQSRSVIFLLEQDSVDCIQYGLVASMELLEQYLIELTE